MNKDEHQLQNHNFFYPSNDKQIHLFLLNWKQKTNLMFSTQLNRKFKNKTRPFKTCETKSIDKLWLVSWYRIHYAITTRNKLPLQQSTITSKYVEPTSVAVPFSRKLQIRSKTFIVTVIWFTHYLTIHSQWSSYDINQFTIGHSNNLA